MEFLLLLFLLRGKRWYLFSSQQCWHHSHACIVCHSQARPTSSEAEALRMLSQERIPRRRKYLIRFAASSISGKLTYLPSRRKHPPCCPCIEQVPCSVL